LPRWEEHVPFSEKATRRRPRYAQWLATATHLSGMLLRGPQRDYAPSP
jgi:hypothetical protein